MEFAIIIILIVSVLLFALQMSFFEKKWVQWLYLGAAAIGIYLAYPLAIEESYASIRQTMTNAHTIGDFSALVIAEALLGCLLSITQISILFGERIKKWWRYATYFSGVVVFIALFYLETLLFITVRGFDFQLFAAILALAIPAAVWLIKRFLYWLVPEDELRAEMKFFLHLIQILLAMVLSIIVLRLPVNTATQQQTLTQSAIILLFALVVAAIGFVFYGIKIKKIWK